MSRKSNLAKNTLILSVGTFLPKLASFITLPILTGYLTKEEYGTYDLITVLVSLLLPTVTLQIRSAAFRFLIDLREDSEGQKRVVSNIFALTVPLSMLALIVLFFILPGSVAIRIWICAYYLADILVNTVRQISRGIGNNFDYSISAIVSAMGKMVFAVIMVWALKTGLLGAVVSLFAASFVSLIYISVRLKIWRFWRPKDVTRENMKPLLQYSWPMVPNELSLWVMRLSDRAVVTAFIGVAANAVYAAANKIPTLISLAQSTLTLAWQENAAVTSKDDDAEKYYSEMFYVMFNLQAAFFGMVIAAMPILFNVLIKGDYDEAYAQMPILCLGILYSSMATYLGGIYVAYKRSKSVGLTTIAAALINLVVDLALIKFIGLYAASLSTLVSYIALCIFRMVNVRKIAYLTYDYKNIFIVTIIMIAEVVLSYQRNIFGYIANTILAVLVLIVFNQSLLKGIFSKFRKIAGGVRKR